MKELQLESSSIFLKSILLALIYNVLFNSLTTYLDYRDNYSSITSSLVQLNVSFIYTTIIFTALLFCKKIGELLIVLLFAISGPMNYFLFYFGKGIDFGTISDILSIEFELIIEYCGIYPILIAIASATFAIVLCRKIKIRQSYILLLIFCISLICTVIKFASNRKDLNVAAMKYVPVNLFYNIYEFYTHYLPQHNISQAKTDLTKLYNFRYAPNNKEPLIVVFIIGESMRGDLISLNGYHVNDTPLLKQRKNLVSFTHARSSSTSTRISLPYMLTRAEPPNFTEATEQLGLISIFRHLGFKTSWIGNQGLFGAHETTFASNALEAETVIAKLEIQNILGTRDLYDSHLLPFIDTELDGAGDNNQFMVVHLLGSHWNFRNRYPKDFPGLLKPDCNGENCSDIETKNSYFNSILFSDSVLDSIIKKLENKNAIVIYSSDHGISLGENGTIGNAATGSNIPEAQINIAMFAWMSDKYLAQHPQTLEILNAHKDESVSHNNLFHSILDCGQVESDAIVPSLSICRNTKTRD